MNADTLITEPLPAPYLFQAHFYVMSAARVLAGGAEPGLHRELLRVAAELQQREREAMALRQPEVE